MPRLVQRRPNSVASSQPLLSLSNFSKAASTPFAEMMYLLTIAFISSL